MKTEILLAVFQSNDLDKCETAVMFTLGMRCNSKTGQCDPSIPTIQKDTGGWSHSAIRRALKSLSRKGYISVEKSFRNSNKYIIHPEIIELSKVTQTPLRESSRFTQTPQCVQGDHRVGSHRPLTRFTQTPKVLSEVKNEILKEIYNDLNDSISVHKRAHKSVDKEKKDLTTKVVVNKEKDLATKVDQLLNDHDHVLFKTEGEYDVYKIARLINQRDKFKDPEPSPDFIEAVEKCIAYWKA